MPAVLILILLVAIHPGLWAREKMALKIGVQPPQALLRIGQQSFQADQGVYYLNRESLPADGAEKANLSFHAEHYQDQSLQLSWNQLKAGEYPSRLQLQVASWQGFWRRYPWLTGGLILALAGLLLTRFIQFSRQRRQSARLKVLEQLVGPVQADPLLNTVLGGYRLVVPLGSGGMASVYRGVPEESLDAARAVAIKVIRLLDHEPEFARRFHREIAISMKLNHPGLVRILDSGEQNGLCFLVMELVEGHTLSQRIAGGKLAWPEARGLMLQLLEALHYVHQLGILHRDIKPDNVMITPHGRIQLLDFGVARTHHTPTLTSIDQTPGTPAYMAPEPVSSPQSDQYSLGVTFFELLCGCRPFVHQEPLRLLLMHRQDPAPKLSSLRPDLPEELEGLLDRMLAKDPQQRFPSLVEIRALLLGIAQ